MTDPCLRSAPTPPTARNSWTRSLLLVGATVAELALLRAPRHSVFSVVLVLGAGAAAGVLVILEHRNRQLRIVPVGCAIGLVMFAAVFVAPRTSDDLWSYTMYGRMVTVYHDSPYEHVPAAFRPDPFVRRVSPRWRHRASVYGPFFVAVSAAGALVAGDSALVARLFFQMLAALALIAVLVIVWRTTRSVAAILFLGLNPVLAVIVVNGGHNDMLIGLAILGAILLARQRRARSVGLLIGLAALVKLTAGLALLGLVLWAWRHHLRRFAVTASATTGLVVILGYLPVMLSASHVLGDADRTVTNASPWNVVADRLLHHDAWRNVARPLVPNDTLTLIFYLGAATVLAIGVSLAWSAGAERRAEPAVGIAVAAYPVAAEYAYPWYATWALPVFAAWELSAISGVVWLQSVVMLAALKLPIAVRGPILGSTLRILLTQVAPPVLLVAFVVVAVRRFPLRSATTRQRRLELPGAAIEPNLDF